MIRKIAVLLITICFSVCLTACDRSIGGEFFSKIGEKIGDLINSVQKEQEETNKVDDEEHAKQAKAGMTYFSSEETEPEKSAEKLTAIITEAYYTNDGSLAVRFCFANGMEKAQRLCSVKVSIKNEDDALVAEGYSDAIREDYTIAADGTATLLLYMLPEHVKIANDALDTISYDITTEYVEAD